MISYIEEYSAAVHSALYVDLPNTEYGGRPTYYSNMFEVFSFPQTWSSTALGFGGLGGQSLTKALTVVIKYYNSFYVYFGGRFAYKVETPNKEFIDDLNDRRMQSVTRSEIYKHE